MKCKYTKCLVVEAVALFSAVFGAIGTSVCNGAFFVSVDRNTESLVRIDPTTGHVETIGPLNLGYSFDDIDLAIHDGQLYGLSKRFGTQTDLFKIDTVTGTAFEQVRLQWNNDDIGNAEGLASDGERLAIGFSSGGDPFRSDALGFITTRRGAVTDAISYSGLAHGVDDIDGLVYDSENAQYLSVDARNAASSIGNRLYHLSRGTTPTASLVGSFGSSVLGNNETRTSDLELLQGDVYAITFIDPTRLFRLNPSTAQIVDTIFLDRAGSYSGLAVVVPEPTAIALGLLTIIPLTLIHRRATPGLPGAYQDGLKRSRIVT